MSCRAVQWSLVSTERIAWLALVLVAAHALHIKSALRQCEAARKGEATWREGHSVLVGPHRQLIVLVVSTERPYHIALQVTSALFRAQ